MPMGLVWEICWIRTARADDTGRDRATGRLGCRERRCRRVLRCSTVSLSIDPETTGQKELCWIEEFGCVAVDTLWQPAERRQEDTRRRLWKCSPL